MTKNIFIGILLLVLGSLLIYMNSTAKEAEQYKLDAEENSLLVKRYVQIAKEEEQKAVEAVALARIAERRAAELVQQYKDCQ